jgi:hypothetical protein
MLKRHAAALFCAVGLTGLLAYGAPAEAATVGAGTVHCHVGGRLNFSPALKSGGTQAETVTIHYFFPAGTCSGVNAGSWVKAGSGSGTLHAPTNDCAKLAGTHTWTLTTFTNWVVKSGKPALAGTTTKFTKETGQTGPPIKFLVSGSATAGSFHGDLANATAVIQESLNTVASECASTGVSVLHIVASSSTFSLHH